MSSSPANLRPAQARHVTVSDSSVTVDLVDGRSITVPLVWYPRLTHGSDSERQNWRLLGAGEGIHWPDLDEDLSVEGLLAGYPSRESQASLDKWLRSRQKAS
jgi:hypothetical protein